MQYGVAVVKNEEMCGSMSYTRSKLLSIKGKITFLLSFTNLHILSTTLEMPRIQGAVHAHVGVVA